jgi:signal transduction histidine kinase
VSRVRSWLDPGESFSLVEGLVSAIGLTAAVTLLIFPLKRVIAAPALDAIYIPMLLFLMAKGGVRLGVVAALLGAAAFSYFHVAPVHTFQNFFSECVAFFAVVIGGFYITLLSGRARAAEERRRQEALAGRRILTAGDEERRRLVRDLHDGAQQQFLNALIDLQRAQDKRLSDPDRSRELVDDGATQVEAGIETLRELAAGVHPAILSDMGLRAALEALVARMPLPVSVEVETLEIPRGLETSVYFFCSEALANVVKHAAASVASVHLKAVGGELRVEVRDDGVGGAEIASGGSGLIGLRDRVGALGGSIALNSSRGGAGTSLVARIPLPN